MFPSDTNLESKVTLEREMNALPEDPPFHILLIGDWIGRERLGQQSDKFSSKPVAVDRDNFDEVFKSFNVQVTLNFQTSESQNLILDFKELDDFHPDNIFQHLPLFSELREIRQRLTNTNTFESAAREVRSWFNEADKSSVDNEAENITGESGTQSPDLLDRILDFNSEDNLYSRQSVESTPLSSFVKNIVKPHLVQVDTVEQSKLLLIVDEVISDIMRKILHHPQFQAIESAWRGVYFLIKRVSTSPELKIFLYNFSKDELLYDLKNNSDLTDSILNKILIKGNSEAWGEKFWSVLGGNYSFSPTIDDVAALIRIGQVAENNKCPFISYSTPRLFGFDSFDESEMSSSWKVDEESAEAKLWNALRTIPEAAYLGLLTARVLGRLPYGAESDPTERFYFEEFSALIKHNDYLWLNPMFIFTALLAQTFSNYGFDITENFTYEVEGFPMHIYKNENETKSQPCAEINMTQANFEMMMEQGLMLVASYKNSDKVRLGRFQSIAYPLSSLKGRWT